MMRDSWMRAGDAFLLVFDVGSRNTFDALDDFIKGILRVKDVDSCADKIPVVLVANKVDLPDEQREISKEEALAKACALGCTYCESSAKMAIGIDEAFETAVREHRRILAMAEGGKETQRRARSRMALMKQCALL